MKIFFLSILFAACLFPGIQAQTCEPASGIPEGLYVWPIPYIEDIPGSGITDTACAGAYFETTISFNVPTSVNYGGLNLPVQSADLPTSGAIVNLPAGFDYSCNPSNCIFENNEKGCLLIYGTAPDAAAGVYDLQINVVIRSFIDIPLTLPGAVFGEGNYYLVVREKSDEACTVSTVKNLYTNEISIRNRPNPFGSRTELVIEADVDGSFDFSVFDVMGAELHRQRVQIYKGENILPFNAARLPEGLYLYSFSNGENASAGKMVVKRD